MGTQPGQHEFTQALLQTCPGVRVALHNRTVQQFETIRFVGWLSTTVCLDFLLTLRDKGGDAQRLSWSTAR
jgi:hypothetical protein